jgi:hypothetical protein
MPISAKKGLTVGHLSSYCITRTVYVVQIASVSTLHWCNIVE